MTGHPEEKVTSDDYLACALGRLWPNREHEASAVAGLACCLGFHYWRKLDLDDLVQDRQVRFTFGVPVSH
jgi:hypothetical protein